MEIKRHQPIWGGDVAEIRLGLQVLLLARPGRDWPARMAPHRVGARRMAALLRALRTHHHGISQLRAFWHRYHLAGDHLSEEALLRAFAVAVGRRRVDALLLLRASPVAAYRISETWQTPASVPMPAETASGAGGPADQPVSQWDLGDRLRYVLEKAAESVPAEAASVLRAMMTKEALAWLVLFAGLEAASFVAGGVGFAADAALMALLWYFCGVSAFHGVIAFSEFLLHTFNAKSKADLDSAADELVRAALLLGMAGLSALGGWAKARALAQRISSAAAADSGPSARGLLQRDAPRRGSSMPRPSTGVATVARTYPYGFVSEAQFQSACQELQSALRDSGIDDAVIGVRGSSVTGSSAYKGTTFGPQSDIDFYVESEQLTGDYTTSKNIPGFVHPNKILPDYPALQAWSEKWSSTLGREVTPGGFVPGTVPDEPKIVVK